jgi:uncharacterized protein YecE (DUF72 family)
MSGTGTKRAAQGPGTKIGTAPAGASSALEALASTLDRAVGTVEKAPHAIPEKPAPGRSTPKGRARKKPAEIAPPSRASGVEREANRRPAGCGEKARAPAMRGAQDWRRARPDGAGPGRRPATASDRKALHVADIHIGISGWRYRPWRGTFYPPRWPQARELEYASRRLGSVEINGSFYSLQNPQSYRAWYDATPTGFVFSVKGGRFITHMRRLANVETPLANFFASGVLQLREKLGPILWQLPPSFRFDADRLAALFHLLPRDTRAAAALARRHDHRVKGRSFTRVAVRRPLRHALEVRHESFRDPRFVALLRRHRIGLVVADTAGRWPFIEDVTADFVYVRLHGDTELYVSGYSDAALTRWAARVRAWSLGRSPRGALLLAPAAPRRRSGRNVYVYFDNDVKVRAPFDAMALAHRLGLGARPDAPPDPARMPEAPRTRWPGFSALARRPPEPGAASAP